MTRLKSAGLILAMTLLGNAVQAAPRIAILNFELNDLTSLPNTEQEQLRTASLRPLLEQALAQAGGYEIIAISSAAQAQANASFGYLFRFDELAAKLGAQADADWVLVGQHSKPSFLFSYLIAHLINVKTQKQVAEYALELKGNHEKVTQRSVKALAGKIAASIKAY